MLRVEQITKKKNMVTSLDASNLHIRGYLDDADAVRGCRDCAACMSSMPVARLLFVGVSQLANDTIGLIHKAAGSWDLISLL